MKSIRLNKILSFIEKEDHVVDVGCDHGYLAIALKKNRLCKSVIATDVNENALNEAKKNIKKNRLSIDVFLSDGLLAISKQQLDTLVIAGMGTSTILHIIDTSASFQLKKTIIQSNNDLYLLRTKMRQKGLYLQEEEVVYEKGHYYVIGLYKPLKKHLTMREKHFGIYKKENKEYYDFLYKNYQTILKKIHHNTSKKLSIRFKIYLLKKYL